jgi:isoquinoline 1-oxidoreductase subunit alpha
MATLNVNGKTLNYEADKGTPLLWVLREQLGLTGTKYGCGIAACGACTVHIDGVPTRSCVRPAASVKATEKVVTIEGLSKDDSHPIQKAWVALDVPQCGFCQSGMIMAASALIITKPVPTDADIDEAMTNICRCGTYNRVRTAIHAAAREMASGKMTSDKKTANALNITHIEGVKV